jgi:hypothetical protein
MTRPLVLLLALALAACAPPASDAPSKPAAKPAAAKPRRCPDPDIRDANDPCSVAYVRRTPGRLTERDLH